LLLGNSDPGRGAAAAILVGAIVSCAAAIAGDNMQDLKAGHILGATPRKQQIMQMIGVIAGALFIAPVLNLLLDANGLGSPTLEHPNPLSAPQATLMMSVATGIFGGDLPWDIIAIGASIGVVIIILDEMLKRRNSTFRMPVLAVAVGLYLPFELDSSIFLGGLLAWFVERGYKLIKDQKITDKASNVGLLFASGLITGEALTGILIALVATFGWDIAVGDEYQGGSIIGLVLLFSILILMYRTIQKTLKEKL
jgi:putative OPT family oligopeptide transporter